MEAREVDFSLKVQAEKELSSIGSDILWVSDVEIELAETVAEIRGYLEHGRPFRATKLA